MSQIGDQAATDRIGGQRHDDRNLTGGTLGGPDRRLATGHDDLDWKLDQFLSETFKALHSPSGVTLIQHVVATFIVAKVAHAEDKLAAQVLSCWISARATVEITEAYGLSLLRARCERPRSRRAAEQRDELAPLQSIELHLLAQPTLGQHIASVRIKSAPRCGARFRPG